ncbi:phage regulatory protein/antirepressor Ant [Pseudochelatococcus contaminans]|uniref:Phage regulator Rha-like protein n=1 Tax=Pseudochelatococcus contaminans TaxID=1538103 RepID=A0A7W6EFF1_9HYPH|nr:phage regulatory protein/antirepressor Ant [Pseudochelatococcus contaminans]MBB3808746.1 phage regulator Rha-like protein [Pseudochelatococcus contaminans]
MAIPANSTRAPVAHRRTDIVPHELPKQYAIQSDGIHQVPMFQGVERQVFSTVIPPRKRDAVALWRRPETLGPGDHQVVVYILSENLPANVRFGDTANARTPEDVLIYVESVDHSARFAYRASEIEAIHTWVCPLPAGRETYKLIQQEREANKEPVAAAQNELSLFTPTAGEPLAMSSREIAELTIKNHADVLRDIRNMLETLGEGTASKFAGSYKDASGKSNPVFNLPKRETLILVSGYRVDLRAKIIDRWMELEEAVKQPAKPAAPEFPIPQTFAEALMLAANQAAQIEHQKVRIEEKNAQIADMREDVDALDRIAGADDLFGLRQAVAMLQTTQNKFVAWLQRNGWAYRQTGSKRLLAYADKRKAGYATNKATIYEKPDGSEGINETLKFTPAGIVKLAKALNVTLTDGDLRTLRGDKGEAS